MTPLVTFWQTIPAGVAPRRASVDVNGTLPSAALRYCEPVRTASSFGYHLYPPMDLGILFDGASFQWSYDHDGQGVGTDWWPLMPDACFPGHLDYWNARAPPAMLDYVPPLLAIGEDLALLQVWTGTIAQTRPDWSLLIRGPVNDSRRSLGYEVLEGIVASDQYGGHLFGNLRFFATDTPILLLRNRPLLQVVPVHRAHYADALLDNFVLGDIDDVPAARWASYQAWIVDRPKARPFGDYAVRERKRRAEER